ncbi:MAG: hypothetical protein K6G30_12570, partial [Acetatifactor sp.]|nr:hypothetical protein [Acetatifactor sp.]
MAKTKFWIIGDKIVEGTYEVTPGSPAYILGKDGKQYVYKNSKGYPTMKAAQDAILVPAVPKAVPSDKVQPKETGKTQMDIEQEFINKDHGKAWGDYVAANLNFNGVPSDADAVCFVDGSFEDAQMQATHVAEGSFGIIIVPVNARKHEPCIVESCHMKENADKFSFEQTYYDENGVEKEKTPCVELGQETVEAVRKLHESRPERSYLGNGYADGIEFEGAYRVIDLCLEKNYKNIYIVCDCDNVLKRINHSEKATDSIAIPRFMAKYAEFQRKGGKAFSVEVGSHENAAMDSL